MISVIIRTKNEERFLGQTLKSVFEQDVKDPFEVVIVDSGSTDRTIEITRNFDVTTHVIPGESFQYGSALNFGVGRSKGNIICSLSAHCVPPSARWLAELTAPIAGDSVHATFGRQLPVKGMDPFFEASLTKHFPAGQKPAGRLPFSNANCAFLKSLWEENHFDEILPSFEDYLWYRCLKDRYRFQYCPNAVVYHGHPFSLRAILRRSYRDGRALRMMRERYGIDLIKDYVSTRSGILMHLIEDMRGHIRFFSDGGNRKAALITPAVRLLSYLAYWKGYRKAVQD